VGVLTGTGTDDAVLGRLSKRAQNRNRRLGRGSTASMNTDETEPEFISIYALLSAKSATPRQLACAIEISGLYRHTLFEDTIATKDERDLVIEALKKFEKTDGSTQKKTSGFLGKKSVENTKPVLSEFGWPHDDLPHLELPYVHPHSLDAEGRFVEFLLTKLEIDLVALRKPGTGEFGKLVKLQEHPVGLHSSTISTMLDRWGIREKQQRAPKNNKPKQ